MNFDQLHMEIARERFLEMLAAEPNSDAGPTAVLAIDQANEFVTAYIALGPQASQPAPAKKTKGCAQCFGSGGKVGSPCKVCKGSGRVPV